MLVPPEQMIGRLEDFIAAQGRYAVVKAQNLRRLSGGVSNEIWAFDALLDNGEADRVRRKLVLRLDPASVNVFTSRRAPSHDCFSA
jgi:hypothetical protein